MILLIILIILTIGSSFGIAISVIKDFDTSTLGWSIALGLVLFIGWGLAGFAINIKEQTFIIPSNEIHITLLNTHVAVEYENKVYIFDDAATYKLVEDTTHKPVCKVTLQFNLYNYVNERKYFLTKYK